MFSEELRRIAAITSGSTVEPEQWLQRHPEAGSSWPSWPQASHDPITCSVSAAIGSDDRGGYEPAAIDREGYERNGGGDRHSWSEAHAAHHAPAMAQRSDPILPVLGTAIPALRSGRREEGPFGRESPHAPAMAQSERYNPRDTHTQRSEATRARPAWHRAEVGLSRESINSGDTGQGGGHGEAGLRDARAGGGMAPMPEWLQFQGMAPVPLSRSPRTERSRERPAEREKRAVVPERSRSQPEVMGLGGSGLQGYLAHEKPTPPLGKAFSYERGTPVSQGGSGRHVSPRGVSPRGVSPTGASPRGSGLPMQEAWRGGGYLSPRNPEELGVMV